MTDNKKIFYVENASRMADVVESMNTIILALNDESPLYDEWLYIVPDEADREDFKYIAESHDLLADTIESFRNIVKKYLK